MTVPPPSRSRGGSPEADRSTLARPPFESVAATFAEATEAFDPDRRGEVDDLSATLMQWDEDRYGEQRASLLSRSCLYYQRIGCSADGIASGEAARDLAARLNLEDLERRACNALSSAYLDGADFAQACRCLERALSLARESTNPLFECEVYATTGALFKEMGCYVEAIAVIDRSLSVEASTSEGEVLRVTSATSGLFCAHRLRDEPAAVRYLSIAATGIENPQVDAVTRAVFEYNRAMYLLSHGERETAAALIDAAVHRAPGVRNARVEILLAIASSLCDWATRLPERADVARKRLRVLYHRSRSSNLYQDDVLRALVEVHSRATSREDAEVGVAYATELVEYTTRVKHARFYRQITGNGLAVPVAPSPTDADSLDTPPYDPFVNAHRWLAVDAPVPAGDGDLRDRAHDLRKHDELTAIHDDLAAMRTAALRTSIGTVAYGTAENWALAAEFFDDQTGQHCFRVGQLAGMLAAEIGMDADYCVRIEQAARLHDIGKITVNALILMKPGPLDPEELTAMRAHAEVGGFLLRASDDPTLQMACAIARHHHEWWNGTGYPYNLAGDRIPLEARICAFADVYDALKNTRSYKRAWSHDQSVEQMRRETGTHFDPRLMTPFLRVLERPATSRAASPPMQLHLKDMDANELLVSRRRLLATIGEQ